MNWELLTWVDYVIIGIIVISTIISLVRGFVREAFSLVIWIASIWIAITYSADLSVKLMDYVELPSARLGAAFAALFVAALIVGSLLGFLLSQLVEKTGLSGTDRLIGMVFGIARGVVLIALIVTLSGLTVFPEDQWWQEAQLIGHFEPVAVWIQGFMPPEYASYFAYQSS
ncbi:MAG TPA: CvpA family protein [Chromatiaceae bacterium]|nr:CvpA family protein [Chromatiaceae bacterium]HIN82594.1 CvpA family protein [Chromatiales bacterium]HIA08236.1 CvpA family protein [Chromatiaceae bacterium]HIB83873.1 CvpA family protein [Chromatiaceae bacterium]HIO13700.1 CvpA family protein [Chromatiales bacterium]